MYNGFWTLARQSSVIITNNVRAIDFTPGEANKKGAVNITEPFRLDQEWSVSFNYRAIRPRGSALGDGFFVGVHGGTATAYDGGTFGYNDSNQRLNEATAYGLQVYIYSSYSQLVWVNNNNIYKALGPIVTNRSLVVWSKLDETPMRVTMSYDGAEKLVVSFSQGGSVLAVTNALAGADFATKFAGGTARIGIWGFRRRSRGRAGSGRRTGAARRHGDGGARLGGVDDAGDGPEGRRPRDARRDVGRARVHGDGMVV